MLEKDSWAADKFQEADDDVMLVDMEEAKQSKIKYYKSTNNTYIEPLPMQGEKKKNIRLISFR